jgi:hypothetical protein
MSIIPKLLVATVATLILAAPAGAATQDVQITLDDQNASVEGVDGSGWATLTLDAPRDVYYSIVRLRPGRDTSAFASRVLKGLRPDQMESWGTTIAAGGARAKAPYRTTVDLQPGWYEIVVAEGDETQYAAGGFTVRDQAAEPPTAEPVTTASIQLRDFRFVAPRTLSAGGEIKIVNAGRQIHELVLGKVRGSMSAALKLARQGKLEQLRFAGPPTQLIGIVSGGTTNIVRPTLATGRYLMVCAYGDQHSHGKPHAALGMVQAITVR